MISKEEIEFNLKVLSGVMLNFENRTLDEMKVRVKKVKEYIEELEKRLCDHDEIISRLEEENTKKDKIIKELENENKDLQKSFEQIYDNYQDIGKIAFDYSDKIKQLEKDSLENMKLKERIKELEEKNQLLLKSKIGVDLSFDDYIPKSLLKEKIEELDKEINYYTEHFLYNYASETVGIKKCLKELLEKRK